MELPKEMIDKVKIETRAIHFLETPIVECDYLSSSISSMDKELSWDGYIYTYHSKMFVFLLSFLPLRLIAMKGKV